MKKITNKFIKVGTNPYIHIKKYLTNIDSYDVKQEFFMDLNNSSLRVDDQDGEVVFSKEGKSTFEQYCRCWVSLGFMFRDGNVLTKLIEPQSGMDELIELAKCNILKNDVNSKISAYKNTILIKLFFLENKNLIENKNFFTNNDELVTIDKIKKEIGDFEREIHKDKTYMEMLKALEWEE